MYMELDRKKLVHVLHFVIVAVCRTQVNIKSYKMVLCTTSLSEAQWIVRAPECC